MADLAREEGPLSSPFMWSGSTDLDPTRTRFFVFAVVSTSDRVLLARSGEDFDRTVEFEKLRFTAQSVAAHGTWLLVFSLVSAVHLKRARPVMRAFVGPAGFA